MLFLVLLGLVAATSASRPDCVVSNWRDWSPCTSNRYDGPQAQSYHADAPEVDTAHAWMQASMKKKAHMHAELHKCRTQGTCPEMAAKPTEGPIKCVDGQAGSWKCWNVDQVSFIDLPDLGYDPPIPGDGWYEANDIWGWTDPETNDEYVIIGLTGGSSFVRITPDPENPTVLGFLRSRTGASMWRDMKVVNNHVFIVSEASNHGMQIFDLTTLRGRDDFQILEATATYSEFGNAHNIVANEEAEFVYVVGCTQSSYPRICRGGLHMVDVSDPRNPTFAGCFSDDGYVHDAQCVLYSGPDTRYTGQDICFGYNEDSLTIVDVTVKSSPVMLSRVEYNNNHYTHQGWLTEDQSVALMDDEADEQRSGIANTRTLIWDVSDLRNPSLQNSFFSAETAIDHNQYVRGDYTYQANYQAGLQLLRIDQPNYDLERVGYYDVYPSRTTANFNGAWSNYPYFQSGVVAVSSIEYGLFLLRPDWAAIDAYLQSKTAHTEQTRYRDVLFAASPDMCPRLFDTREC